MFVELWRSSLISDVRCTFCGQGFLVFSSRLAHLHHHQVQVHLQHALREQHTDCNDHSAHPVGSFSMLLPLDTLRPAA